MNHNFSISPFGYSMTKHPITDSRLKREFGNNDKTHSYLNLKPVMNLEYIYLYLETLAQNTLDLQGKVSNKKDKYNVTSKYGIK